MKDIKTILAERSVGSTITAKGWARTKRDTKNAIFVELNDGSCFTGLQCVFDTSTISSEAQNALTRTTTGAALAIKGTLVDSPSAGQPVELKAEYIEVVGECPADSYPLQKKAHSLEFLREIAHLRPRTNTIGAAARMRDEMAFAVHSFYHERGFRYIHTPIITASDCEGAGEMFQATTLDLDAIAKNSGPVDYGKDFLAKKPTCRFPASSMSRRTAWHSARSTPLVRLSALKIPILPGILQNSG